MIPKQPEARPYGSRHEAGMSRSSTPSERVLRIHRAATAYADHHHSDPRAYGIISIQMHDGLIDPDDVLASVALIQ